MYEADTSGFGAAQEPRIPTRPNVPTDSYGNTTSGLYRSGSSDYSLYDINGEWLNEWNKWINDGARDGSQPSLPQFDGLFTSNDPYDMGPHGGNSYWASLIIWMMPPVPPYNYPDVPFGQWWDAAGQPDIPDGFVQLMQNASNALGGNWEQDNAQLLVARFASILMTGRSGQVTDDDGPPWNWEGQMEIWSDIHDFWTQLWGKNNI